MTNPIPGNCLSFLERVGHLRAKGVQLSDWQSEEVVKLSWLQENDLALVRQALADPFLAWTMLYRTLYLGFRGNPLHPRPRDHDGRTLTDSLLDFLRLHLRIRQSLVALVDWPKLGVPAESLVGDGGWCDLCGQCCCHAGTVPHPPKGVHYPAFFYHALAGESLYPQPFCPFLFQAIGQPVFFCGIHPIKPIACDDFGKGACERGRSGRGCLPVKA